LPSLTRLKRAADRGSTNYSFHAQSQCLGAVSPLRRCFRVDTSSMQGYFVPSILGQQDSTRWQRIALLGKSHCQLRFRHYLPSTGAAECQRLRISCHPKISGYPDLTRWCACSTSGVELGPQSNVFVILYAKDLIRWPYFWLVQFSRFYDMAASKFCALKMSSRTLRDRLVLSY
jgi:hypothetical protein